MTRPITLEMIIHHFRDTYPHLRGTQRDTYRRKLMALEKLQLDLNRLYYFS